MRVPTIAAAFAALLATALPVGSAYAQAYPTKPVRIIVPFPPGGPLDVQTRILGQKLSEAWSQQVVIDNKAGGNTIIGAELAAKAAPDGYTFLMAIDSTLVMNQYLYAKLPYDPLKDFAPISRAVRGTTIIAVDAATGPKTVKELIERAKAAPGKLTFGSGTVTTQLAGEMFKRRLGLDIVFVPYKGSAPSVQALLSHEITFIVDGLAPSVPHIQSGAFRVLAVTGAKPAAALPGVPTLADAANLPGFDVATWQGLVAPAGTPAAIIGKVHGDIARALAMPDVVQKLQAVGLSAEPSASPAEFAAFIRGEADRWAKAIPEAGIKPE
jgi:tripartite-type tricarboxylate transporter receptor subunit TctC